MDITEKQEQAKREILSALAADFSDDKDFLNKVNKLTFGLLKQDNLNDYGSQN